MNDKPKWLTQIHCAEPKEVLEWFGENNQLGAWEFCLDADKADCEQARSKNTCFRSEDEYAAICQIVDDDDVEQLLLF